MQIQRALSFDDVMLVPRASDVHSRSDVSLSTSIAGIQLGIPILAANMTSVCESEMALAMHRLGGLGIIHRFCSIEKQVAMLHQVALTPPFETNPPQVGFAIGVEDDWIIRNSRCKGAGGKIACLDVAHAHHHRVLDLLDRYFRNCELPLIIGQIATAEAAGTICRHVPEEWRPRIAFKVSIGGGSLCTTRIRTGFGIPTLQAVMDIAEYFPGISLIADGGIKNSGDIVKALAAGADAVMLGRLLAGTEETPGNIIPGGFKMYRGSASFSDKAIRNEQTHIEGEEMLVPLQGPVKRVVDDLLEGVRSGFSYGGARDISELQDGIEFIEITAQGYHESLPHAKYER